MRPTLIDIAFRACTALQRVGIVAVLTGGSAATFYAPHAYQSRDADFILQFGGTRATVDPALAVVGFHRTSAGYYASDATEYTIEFPSGPLAVGADLIHSWSTIERFDETLHVLDPTDAVRDRFIAYLAWDDISSLRAALDVATAIGDRFDRARFETWVRREVATQRAYDPAKLVEFFRRLPS